MRSRYLSDERTRRRVAYYESEGIDLFYYLNSLLDSRYSCRLKGMYIYFFNIYFHDNLT